MPEWEYRTVRLSDLPRRTEEIDLLNDAGEYGWELVNITPKNVAYMRRQLAGRTAQSARSSPRTRKNHNPHQMSCRRSFGSRRSGEPFYNSFSRHCCAASQCPVDESRGVHLWRAKGSCAPLYSVCPKNSNHDAVCPPLRTVNGGLGVGFDEPVEPG